MPDLTQIGNAPSRPATCASPPTKHVLWLQSITLAWMLIELGVSVYAAIAARSPVLLAFGSDSLVELLSATVVLLQWTPSLRLSEHRAGRIAGALLFALSFVITAIAIAFFILKLQPEPSPAGIAIAVAALIAMPLLAALKRREARRSGNAALAADAVQSATCAYLAIITLAGLGLNAAFHIPWFDPLAALAAIPLLLHEAQSAWRGHPCACC